MDRRNFIKTAGVGTAGLAALSTSVLGISGCNGKRSSAGKIEGEMEYRNNHNSGDKVSLLGYGCMRWQVIKDENGKDIVNQESVNELVDYALEHGVNYFDCAPVYLRGQCEKATGDALKRHPRDSYFIATKLSNFSDPSRETSLAMYNKSFENFSTDYIDYYLLHSISSISNFEKRFVQNGMLDFLMEERNAGRIRNLGFSCHCNRETFDYVMEKHSQYHWDFVQIQMNYLDWKYAEKPGSRETNAEYLYTQLQDRNIPVVIMEPLLGGRLADLPDALSDRLKSHENQRSVASWAFRYLGTYPGILTVLSGMTYKEHLVDNLKSFCGFKALDEKEMDMLDSIAKQLSSYNTVDCTACEYCMPCPYGINIPGIFAHYNKCVNEGIMPDPKEELDDNEERRAFKRARREFLIGYDRAIPTIRQADHCIGCGLCEAKCPQNIKIPLQLQRIDRYVNNLKKTR